MTYVQNSRGRRAGMEFAKDWIWSYAGLICVKHGYLVYELEFDGHIAGEVAAVVPDLAADLGWEKLEATVF
jgi:hypothetical protein